MAKTIKLELRDNERLLIDRMRKGLSQEKYAKLLGYSRQTYSIYEISRDALPSEVNVPIIEDITVPEACVIVRHRACLTQKKVAEHIGVSRNWLGRMERGVEDPARLIDYLKRWSKCFDG